MQQRWFGFLLAAGCGLAAPTWAWAAPGESLWTVLKPSSVSVEGAPPIFARLARSVGPAVVNIATIQAEKTGASSRRTVARTIGTGFVIHKDGYILTNHHVIDNSEEIRVRLADEREFAGRLVGSDEKTDIALVKIDAAGELAVAPLGDSDKIQIGEWVMAIGNPFGLDHTVTVGIVSGKGRRSVRPLGTGNGFFDFIQTDASINDGNSGGPLINARGEVIGVNTAINAQGQGIAFAIPINMVKALVPILREQGRLSRSWIGATMQSLTLPLSRAFGLPDTHGALVADVSPGSPADRSGLVAGDVVLELDGRPMIRADDLTWQLMTAGAGKRVSLTVSHAGARRKLTAMLEADPNEPEAAPRLAERSPPSPLGMTVSDVPAGRSDSAGAVGGVVVLTVEPGSPASEAGIERGDYLLRVGEQQIGSLDDYRRAVHMVPRGALIRILARRENRGFWAAFEKR